MKSHPYSTSLVPAKLALHNESRTISKLKPKIRIIHIVAPEIIKTDVHNFRELVQRLTGKPEERKESEKQVSDFPSVAFPSKTCGRKPKKNMKPAIVPALQIKHRIKESEEIIWGDNPSALLGFLGDVDGFIHDVNVFPLLPFRSSQINTFGEIPLF
ncbi:VQ motif-containing protein 25-like [Primulina huaijiensis]|uniref:VQ motif-containing protein 25-like n=1 Tax=Primulina huaijiensis TaxID=1492673 RepID=UPI003CC78F59